MQMYHLHPIYIKMVRLQIDGELVVWIQANRYPQLESIHRPNVLFAGIERICTIDKLYDITKSSDQQVNVSAMIKYLADGKNINLSYKIGCGFDNETLQLSNSSDYDAVKKICEDIGDFLTKKNN